METVNANIPLQAGNIQLGMTPERTMSLMEFGQQMRARQQKQASENALRSIFSNPQAMGPDGQLRPEALNAVMQVDPQTGMQLRQQMMQNQVQQSSIAKNRAQTSSAELEQNLKREDFIQKTVREPALIAYEEAKKKGWTDQQASEVAQAEYGKGLAAAKGSGLFHEDEVDKFPPAFDYQRVFGRSQSLKDYRANQEKLAADKRADDAAKRAERAETEREQHDRATERHMAASESRLAQAISGEGKPPAGYRKTADGNLEFIPGGPADPQTKEGKLGARESVFVGRVMMSANEAAKDLENVVQLPMTASTGWFGGRKQGPGIMDATSEVLANKMTSQEVQSYNVLSAGFQRSLAAIEASGLAPSGTLSHQMDAVQFKEGDTQLTKLQKLAQTRQIVEAGLETTMSNPRIPDAQRDHMKDVLKSIRKSVPFTQTDLVKLQTAQEKNPKATLKDVMPKGGPDKAKDYSHLWSE